MRIYLFMVTLGVIGVIIGLTLPLIPPWMEGYHDARTISCYNEGDC